MSENRIIRLVQFLIVKERNCLLRKTGDHWVLPGITNSNDMPLDAFIATHFGVRSINMANQEKVGIFHDGKTVAEVYLIKTKMDQKTIIEKVLEGVTHKYVPFQKVEGSLLLPITQQAIGAYSKKHLSLMPQFTRKPFA